MILKNNMRWGKQKNLADLLNKFEFMVVIQIYYYYRDQFRFRLRLMGVWCSSKVRFSHIQTNVRILLLHMSLWINSYHIGEINFSDPKVHVEFSRRRGYSSEHDTQKCKHNNWRDDQSLADISSVMAILWFLEEKKAISLALKMATHS